MKNMLFLSLGTPYHGIQPLLVQEEKRFILVGNFSNQERLNIGYLSCAPLGSNIRSHSLRSNNVESFGGYFFTACLLRLQAMSEQSSS